MKRSFLILIAVMLMTACGAPQQSEQQTEQQTKCDAQHHTGKAEGCRDGNLLFQQSGNGHLGINRQASSQIALEQVFDETP